MIKAVFDKACHYEIGKENVGSIEFTDHGSENAHIYEIRDVNNKLVIFAGFLPNNYTVVETDD